MIFLPNKYERYTSSLRNYIQKLYNINGSSQKLLLNFKKIYEFEALFLNNEKLPCDIKQLSSRILFASFTKQIDKNKNLEFSINTKENYILNIKVFSIILLRLARVSEKIDIFNSNGYILIKSKTDCQIQTKFLKAINAFSLYEHNCKTLLIIINAEKTAKKSIDIKEEWDIFNPFSPINLYLS